MSYVIRPFINFPRCHRCNFPIATLTHLLKPPPPLPLSSPTTKTTSNRNYTQSTTLHCYPHFNLNALKLPNAPPQSPNDNETDSFEDDDSNQTRNQKKRVARRAVKFGMQLAKFSPLQIKRILTVAKLHREVFDAIMLVKKLGRDVREAKRRQFNLIGKFLRDVDPEVMDNLILATLEGDKKKFEKLFGLGSWDVKEDEDDMHSVESEDDKEDPQYHNGMVERWYEGLANKDIGVTNEVYSLHDIEFDRQELRRLVRRVHSLQVDQINSDEKVEVPEAEAEAEAKAREKAKAEAEAEAKHLRAKRSLTRFLRNIAKQIPDD